MRASKKISPFRDRAPRLLASCACLFLILLAGFTGPEPQSLLSVVETQQVTASDAASGDNFGYATSLDAGRLLVGAYGKNASTGAAYVFAQSGATWSQEAKLTA